MKQKDEEEARRRRRDVERCAAEELMAAAARCWQGVVIEVIEEPGTESPPEVGTKAGAAQQTRHLLAVRCALTLTIWLKPAAAQNFGNERATERPRAALAADGEAQRDAQGKSYPGVYEKACDGRWTVYFVWIGARNAAQLERQSERSAWRHR